jgi:uncharacterized small protein (DUF1192 family)
MIRYNHEAHKYFHNETELISVTTMMQKVGAVKPVPEGIKAIEDARIYGTKMHQMLQNAVTNPLFDIEDLNEDEKHHYDFFHENYCWEKDLRAEVIVNDLDLGIAGTADLVVSDKKVVDHKFTSTFKDSHLWQACIYALLEDLHEAEVINYKLRKVYKAEEKHFEMAQKIINAYSNDEVLEMEEYITPDLEARYLALHNEIEQKKAELEELKAIIAEEVGESTAKGKILTVSYKKPSIRKSLDKAKLEKEFEITDDHYKITKVKASYSFSIKKEK